MEKSPLHASFDSLFAALPKAELHLHLEGCLTPALVVQLAARHGEKLSPENVIERYNTGTFPEFLDLFKWATSFLREPQDYARLAEQVVSDLRNQNCRYAEITLSVGVMLLRKQDVHANFAAIREAVTQAPEGHYPRIQWIFDAVRQFGPDKAMDVARLAAETKSQGVVAFGIGGDEESLPAADFRKVFDYAASEGLHRVAHAGEIGGPQSVRDAIEILGAERIGHGIAAIHDEKLMDLFIERQIPLEICPTSNLHTGALAKLLSTHVPGADAIGALGGRSLPAQAGFSPPAVAGSDIKPPEINGALAPEDRPRLEDHPLAKFVARGVPVTLSTDDPGMFQTTLNAEYATAHQQMGLTIPQLVSIAENGFRHSFLPAAEKQSTLDHFRAEASKLNLQ